MPGFDGTGPMRMGPLTGGGRGFCAIPLRPARAAYAGRGFSMPYVAPSGILYRGVPSFALQVSREEQLEYLKGSVQSIREDLKAIEERIQQIESEKD